MRNNFRNVVGITIVLLVKEDINLSINTVNDFERIHEQIPAGYLPIISKLINNNPDFDTQPSRFCVIGHSDKTSNTPYEFRPGECIPYAFGLYPMDADTMRSAKQRFDCDISLKHTRFVPN